MKRSYVSISVFISALAALTIVIAMMMMSKPIAAQTGAVLYAKSDGSGDCTSWVEACDLQTALSEAVAEDEAAYEDRTQSLVEVPVELVPAVRELIAKHKP